MENEDVEECIEKEDDVRFDRDAVKEDGLRGNVERIGHKSGLDHDERVVNVGFIENMPDEKNKLISRQWTLNRYDQPVERSLIWTVIKHLQKLTPPQMEHKLRILLPVLGELLA